MGVGAGVEDLLLWALLSRKALHKIKRERKMDIRFIISS